jgi:hypothetical protein
MSRAISAGQALDYYKKEFTKFSKTITTAKQAKFRACRVSRAVRMVKESLRPETMQLGRWKEFRHSQVTVSGGKNSFAPKGFFPFLASQASERKPDTFEFPRDFRHSE